MTNIKIGDIINATVTGIENYGIFVNYENTYTGLVHISEISHDFVKNVNDYAIVGEKLKVKILEIDEINKKLKLNLKDLENKYNRKTLRRIKETTLGFTTLEKNLNDWINIKKKELLEKEKLTKN